MSFTFSPGCCAAGLRCFERDPYFATCMELCSPDSSSWTCNIRHHVDAEIKSEPEKIKSSLTAALGDLLELDSDDKVYYPSACPAPVPAAQISASLT